MPGFIIYRGPSMLDGAPVVAVAITKVKASGANRKTGDIVQTYILRADVAPLDALKSGADSSICGDCKHRPYLGGACYVNVGQGPRSVYAALQRGKYPDACTVSRWPEENSPRAWRDGVAHLGIDRLVRLGTYGDPMAIPADVWEALLLHSKGHTGYTHGWLTAPVEVSQRERISRIVMASADTETEADMARSIGLRTFRVRRPDEPLMPGEFVCPASDEAGKRRTCATCLACDGSRDSRAASPVIIAHGSKASRFIRINPA